MPRFDTSFNFGANVAKPKVAKAKAAPKPRAAKRPKGPKSKSRAFFSKMHGS
jgi:hypothetical protein